MIRVLVSLLGLSALPVAALDDVEGAAAAILAGIETPWNTAIPFTERRKNSLLEQPLILTGEISLTVDGGLSKLITHPFHERVTISDDAVVIEKNGKSRRLPLGRKKGLKQFYSALQALLERNVETLLDLFEVEQVTSDDSWMIVLVPANADLAETIERMVISGRRSSVTAIRTVQSAETWQDMSFVIDESG